MWTNRPNLLDLVAATAFFASIFLIAPSFAGSEDEAEESAGASSLPADIVRDPADLPPPLSARGPSTSSWR